MHVSYARVKATRFAYRCLGVVETRNDGGVEDGNAGPNGLARVVQKGLEVGVGGESKPCNTLLGTVDDQESAIRKGYAGGVSAQISANSCHPSLPDYDTTLLRMSVHD